MIKYVQQITNSYYNQTINYIKTKQYNQLQTLIIENKISLYKCIIIVFQTDNQNDEKLLLLLHRNRSKFKKPEQEYNFDDECNLREILIQKVTYNSMSYLVWFIRDKLITIDNMFNVHVPNDKTFIQWNMIWKLLPGIENIQIDELFEPRKRFNVFLFLIDKVEQSKRKPYIFRYIFKHYFQYHVFILEEYDIGSLFDMNVLVQFIIEILKFGNRQNYILQFDPNYIENQNQCDEYHEIYYNSNYDELPRINFMFNFSTISQKTRVKLFHELMEYGYSEENRDQISCKENRDQISRTILKWDELYTRTKDNLYNNTSLKVLHHDLINIILNFCFDN